MKQVIVRSGRAEVDETPAPKVAPGAVLVATRFSCISPGTELSGIQASGTPLWKRAARRPQHVLKVLNHLAREGVSKTRDWVESKLPVGYATGYSAAGVVLEVGEGVLDLRPGQAVACAGAQCAHHAEVLCVPRNLCVPVPEGLDLEHAATVTLGAIALQGVRRLEPTLGETIVVLGLGILGQLTVQLLRANGCRVIGLDLNPERVKLARELGMELGVEPGEDALEAVDHLSKGLGADGVVITAATPSDEVVSSAFRMCRRKGRVVLVGDVGLNLKRADFYVKELDFRISTSYGPGRYDRRYEEEGLDYPLAYVRWTENRNMEEYLRLLASERLSLEALIQIRRPLEAAGEAYAAFQSQPRPLVGTLSYGSAGPELAALRTVQNTRARPAKPGQLRLAVVGAGSFVQAVHLPNLRADRRVALQAIVGQRGHATSLAARRWGARYATTEIERVLEDPEVDALLIGTRHDTHGDLTLRALKAGKHVLVEKPLALQEHELAAIEAQCAEDPQGPLLLTGFNRRFAPTARALARALAGSGPAVLSYRMNVSPLPRDHWLHSPAGGGRNLGEACHIYDLFTALTGARVTHVQAAAASPGPKSAGPSDHFVATLSFEGGSVATLVYALGSPSVRKERLEVMQAGRVLVLDDYVSLRVLGGAGEELEHKAQEKGHSEELGAFVDAIQSGGPWPIPLWQQLQASRIALEVEAQLGGLQSPASSGAASEGSSGRSSEGSSECDEAKGR